MAANDNIFLITDQSTAYFKDLCLFSLKMSENFKMRFSECVSFLKPQMTF